MASTSARKRILGKAVTMIQESASNPLNWGKGFRQASRQGITDDQLQINLRGATSTIREKRGIQVSMTPDWEKLRSSAAAIKRYSLDHLPELLLRLEEQVTASAGVVHWAKDAQEANEIAFALIAKQNATEVVKVKSMVTQEIGLNDYLKARGVTAFETDLAELIVQLSGDSPSHIVVPAIHKNRREIRDVFARELGATTPGQDGPHSDDPKVLTEVARKFLREKFLTTKVAISGANMMVAETGALAIFESEGNGRMCLTLPETLISIVGIEKVVPTMRDAEAITELLPRSATGEKMNPYTSWWTGVTKGDGPKNFHLILLDNGRSKVLADPIGSDALACIRCGACMNVCPVYAQVGGHAYQSVYPGPIGAILTPQLLGGFSKGDVSAELPYASTLCGACFDVCPVKIDIPSILVDLRRQTVSKSVDEGGATDGWAAAMKASSAVMRSGRRMALAETALPIGRVLAGPDRQIEDLPWPISAWTTSRNLPAPPEESFRKWMKRHEKSAEAKSVKEEKQPEVSDDQ